MIEISGSALLASLLAGAAPILLATLGETITERAGVINLSLDGTILLGAMTAFAVACSTGSLAAGYLAAGAVGAFLAGIVAATSLYWKVSQVAVGFVLTLMAKDLAYFLGNPYVRLHGPSSPSRAVPFLRDVPFFGTVLFDHPLPVYFSMVFIFLCWWYLYRTSWGLELRAVGENPRASHARGIDPKRLRMAYALAGGMVVGFSGAVFSLCVKPGWGRPQGAEGTGWIALALVIFGGWHPFRAALGAYLFAFLQIMGIHLQGWFPSVPAQVFQVAPFPLMIFTLLALNLGRKEPALSPPLKGKWAASFRRPFSVSMPSSLGRPLDLE